MKERYAFITDQTKDTESKEDFAFPVEYMFKDVPKSATATRATPSRVTLSEMDRWGIERGMVGVGDADGDGREALKRTPTGSSPRPASTPTRAWRASAGIVRAYETLRRPGGRHVPGGDVPAGRHQRQEDVPDLRQVRGAGHPRLLLRRRARAAAEVRRPSGSS